MKDFSLDAYLADLKELCAIDSGHFHAEGTRKVAEFFEKRYQELGFSTEIRYYDETENDFAPVLIVRNGNEEHVDVMFVAHMDTVFPVGTADKRPFMVDEAGLGHGPGCVDCKGGALSIYYLLKSMQQEGELHFSFAVILNSDEERGSVYSRACFEEFAKISDYCLVFEPGRPKGEYVSTRKGGRNYILKCHGIAAHSGVEPEKGASAILELARWANELYTLTDYEGGTTINIGRFDGGGDNGAVPDYAECTISFRHLREEAPEKLEEMFEKMRTAPFDSRTSIEVVRKSVRPPMMPNDRSTDLFAKLEEAGKENGTPTELLVTGGGSDGNWIAPFGVATLDGCGPCGGKLHTDEEFLQTWTVEPRLDTMRSLLLKVCN